MGSVVAVVTIVALTLAVVVTIVVVTIAVTVTTGIVSMADRPCYTPARNQPRARTVDVS